MGVGLAAGFLVVPAFAVFQFERASAGGECGDDHVVGCDVARDAAGGTYHLCAGAGAIGLGALLDLSHATWSESEAWRRRGTARPALTDLETYRLFERTVEETGDARLRRITRSLSHFVPQLALAKRFETTQADAAVGFAAPAVDAYFHRVLRGIGAKRGRGAEPDLPEAA